MSRRQRGHPSTDQETKYDQFSHTNQDKKFYTKYDWRPEGCDGASKKPVTRTTCDASEILSRRSTRSSCDIRPAGLPCRTQHIKQCRYPRSPGRSPLSMRSVPRSSSTSCDYRQCDASEKFLSRVSSPHSTHDSNRCSNSASLLTPECHNITLQPSRESICMKHDGVAPGMQAAGIITRNYDYPFPLEMHSVVRLHSHLKHQGVYNGLGRLVKQSFLPRPGDVLIVKIPRQHPTKEHGYVQIFTIKHEGCHLCPGDLLLRVGKFVERNTWRYSKRHKLYVRTDEHRWLFVGMIDNFVNLLPVTNHSTNSSHVDQHCRFFLPRRGDMLVHLKPPDQASLFEWFSPKTKTVKGDILVRMYLGEPCLQLRSSLNDLVEGAVEIYLYAGKGFGWIFMGRNDCWFKDGADLLNATSNSPAISS